MLLGEYYHTLDAKGRFILPAKFRDELGENFIITKGLDNCLFVYTKKEWAILENKLKQLPLAKPEARAFVRFFFSGATEAECDKQGRVLLPNVLREFASLDKDIVVIGVSTRIEIWDKNNWLKYNETVSPTVEAIAENIVELGI